MNAIQTIEGYVIGEQKPMKKVLRTKRDKKRRLVEFLIEGHATFVSLATAIKMAENDDIEAVVVRTRSGTVYLRAYPDSSDADNFQSLAD